jgi:hypothetical protein
VCVLLYFAKLCFAECSITLLLEINVVQFEMQVCEIINICVPFKALSPFKIGYLR